jgi:hypothetical protein
LDFPGNVVVLLQDAYWRCILELNKIFSPQEEEEKKVQLCFWYGATKSVRIVQRRYRRMFGRGTLSENSNRERYRELASAIEWAGPATKR